MRKAMPAKGEGFSSEEVAKATGATLRQLQWWDERGIIKPWFGLIEHKRLYSEPQLVTIRRMVQLRNAGVSPAKIPPLLQLEWDTVQPLDRPMVIGKTLLIAPLNGYFYRPARADRRKNVGRRKKRSAELVSDLRRMDEIAARELRP